MSARVKDLLTFGVPLLKHIQCGNEGAILYSFISVYYYVVIRDAIRNTLVNCITS